MITRLAAAVVAALLAPFVVTGLFRLGAQDLLVAVVCLAIGAALVVRRGLLRDAGKGWLVGCVAWAAALAALINNVGRGLDG